MSAAPDQKVSPQLQQFIMEEQAKAQLQQTVARLTDECWDKCMGTPGSSLSSRETACLDNCARRFLDTTQFVVKYFQSKAQAHSGGF
ncbi:TIM8 [Auxenochlorella protothecoides x Auxenochlorella symbiontica]|uniref:Mitochondrial import inner membrane translocase subunit n=1 Tax=Auxenochlorella protothecoides TaxID=3075 RepID=A0A087SJJ6_AUXPR|nr:Mitochondrial import inner membrane translocase subunit Tim8 A [Auxenochlorella protothecoides]KFM25900.1 Mitochondrial import inner membrane translocase subunit Tim8 A [Auxenochlorella protothecoides]RMZ55849.1 hypothetical protein APUTEX25_003815 [Auxenochlorella protothecoides]|eukprot:RMZ55849.1 hypothetical protein APUTEX25_003815 [Auxenochlorella protothecoides]